MLNREVRITRNEKPGTESWMRKIMGAFLIILFMTPYSIAIEQEVKDKQSVFAWKCGTSASRTPRFHSNIDRKEIERKQNEDAENKRIMKDEERKRHPIGW